MRPLTLYKWFLEDLGARVAWKRRSTLPPLPFTIKSSLQALLCLTQPYNSPRKKSLTQLVAAALLGVATLLET